MSTAPTFIGPTPVIWLLTDNKPGHRNQLKGLANRLRVLTGAEVYWIDSTTIKVPLWRAVFGVPVTVNPSVNNASRPSLIIAAGSRTHRLLLCLRRYKDTATVVLMKPAFPRRWVDAAIIPEHDGVSANKHTLVTEGVLNAITPLAQLTHKPEALLLIGGPSTHYTWSDGEVYSQINSLIGQYPDWRWTISSSRRTPSSLKARLDALTSLKVTVVDPDQTHENWLSHQLATSRAVWVTPDSSSMVCEAMTSGVPTGIFELPAQRNSRLVRGNKTLLQRGRITPWPDHQQVMLPREASSAPLWEADRAARWLIKTLRIGRRQ